MAKDLEKQEGTEKATGMLIATYVFAVLGGLLGICLGISVWRNKEYLPSHRKFGLLGAIISIISIIIWKAAMM